jgi:hypothetical protein
MQRRSHHARPLAPTTEPRYHYRKLEEHVVRTVISAVLVFLSVGMAQAEEAKISSGETVNYLIQNYKTAGLRPELTFILKYSPPFLEVTWQRKVVLSDTSDIRLEDQQASIDLRYARFDAWNDGRRDRNVMIVDCWNYFPCYQDEITHRAYGHGEIDYLVSEYASNPIANALNHLASMNEKSRPRSRFE